MDLVFLISWRWQVAITYFSTKGLLDSDMILDLSEVRNKHNFSHTLEIFRLEIEKPTVHSFVGELEIFGSNMVFASLAVLEENRM